MEILGIPWAIALIWAGAAGVSWWWTFIFAAVGLIIYALMRTNQMVLHAQRGDLWSAIPMYYLAQLAMAALLFGVGALIGSVF